MFLCATEKGTGLYGKVVKVTFHKFPGVCKGKKWGGKKSRKAAAQEELKRKWLHAIRRGRGRGYG